MLREMAIHSNNRGDMTKSQELMLKQSELREKANSLLELETRTTDQETEMGRVTTELQQLEPELRAAIAAEPDPAAVVTLDDPETRELRRLTAAASLGSMVSSAVEHRATQGAEAELQQHHGLAGNEVPLEMLRAPVEHRAVTPGPGTVGVDQSEIVQPVFAMGAGAFLGIDRPTVAMGDAVYPVLTSRPTVGGPHADSTDAPETTGAYDAVLLAPERIQASFIYRRRDAARFAGMDASLRSALTLALEEKLDYEAIRGTEGLLTGTKLADHDAAAVTTFASYLSQFVFGRVDGRYAMQAGDLRILMGSSTYAHAGATYRAAQADDQALDVLMAKTGGVRVSAHVPAVSANKQDAVIRLGARRDMVQPLWMGISVITDEVTKSGAGEIEITAVMLMNSRIIRSAGFYKQQTQHA